MPPRRRRASGRWWWRLFGAPVDAESARALFCGAIWDLIRGAAPTAQPGRAALGRRYTEVLLENLGQPGFAELLLVATDLDARHDVVAALLREPYRADFLAPRAGRNRRGEVLDLTGTARDHAIDILASALTPPLIAEPALVTYASDSFWRGETHRMCDRAASVNRLLEEVAAAGATQVIVVSAVAPVPAAHMLRVPRMDPRSRLGEFHATAEAAALRDAHGDGAPALRLGLCHQPGAQSDRTVRCARRVRRSLRPAAGPVGADGARLRGRLPPVHRAGRRRQRRASGAVRAGADDMRPRESADRIFGA